MQVVPVILVLVVLANQWAYIKKIRYESLPSGVTWLIWSFVAGVMFYSQIKEHGFASAWMFLAYTSGALLTMRATAKEGKFEWSRIHKICLTLSVVALLVAVMLSGRAGLGLNIVAHVIGTSVLWRKIWIGESREPVKCWLVWLCCSTSNLLLAIYAKNLLIAPIYYCSHNVILVSLLLWKQPKGRV